MNQAIQKIQSEMAGANTPYISVIGNFLLTQLNENPAIAEKILVERKTLEGSFQAMVDEAKKQAVNNTAVLTDAEGFAIVLKYFEIEGSPVSAVPILETAAVPKKTKKKKPSEKVVNFPGTEFVQTTLDDFFSEGEF